MPYPSLLERLSLDHLVKDLVSLVPTSKHATAARIAAEIAALFPPFDGRTRRSDDTNLKVKIAHVKRYERRIFLLADILSNVSIEIIGWRATAEALGMSERTLRGKVGYGGGRFKITRAWSRGEEVEVIHTERFSKDAPPSKDDPVTRFQAAKYPSFTSRAKPA